MQVHFSDRAPTNSAEARRGSAELNAALHLALLLEGIYAAPRGMLNLSTALTGRDLGRVAHGYTKAFERLTGFASGAASS